MTGSARRPRTGKAYTRMWKAKDGRRLRVCDMGDRHLLNTIKYIPRAVSARWFSHAYHLMNASTLLGDSEAGWQIGQQAEAMMENAEECMWQDRIPPIWYDMLGEAEQRGLIEGDREDFELRVLAGRD